jgi:phosphate transport system substrate-binding protein
LGHLEITSKHRHFSLPIDVFSGKFVMTFRLFVFGLLPIGVLGLAGCTGGQTASSSAAKPQPSGDIVKVSGSSSAYAAMVDLTQAYQTQNPTAQLNVLPKGQAETAIAGVSSKLIDIAFITRPLKPEEKSPNLKYAELAQDGLLVATHPTVKGVTQLSKANLQAIYSGKATNWQEFGGPDAAIVLLDRPEDESAKRLLRKHYLGAELPNAPAAVVLKQEPELITALTNTPYAIGAFSLAYAIAKNVPVNRLTLDGIAPTQDNILAGKYPMVRQLGFVTQNPPNQSVQPLVNFIQGADGRKVVAKAGFTIKQTTP